MSLLTWFIDVEIHRNYTSISSRQSLLHKKKYLLMKEMQKCCWDYNAQHGVTTVLEKNRNLCRDAAPASLLAQQTMPNYNNWLSKGAGIVSCMDLLKPGKNLLCKVNHNPNTHLTPNTLLEQVRHDSVSTIAFKFQAHHLFHIFKFDVSRVQTQNYLTSFQKF